MRKNAEKLLRLSADMEKFMHRDDRLGRMVESVCDDELFEDDLTFVAAATAIPSFDSFLKQVNDRRKEK